MKARASQVLGTARASQWLLRHGDVPNPRIGIMKGTTFKEIFLTKLAP